MTPRFRSRLLVDDPGGLPFTLIAPLVYDSALLGRTITVPAWFVTDLASIPRWCWAIFPPVGKYDGAAVLHDWLYRAGGVTRAQADAVFQEAMGVLHVGRVVRWVLYRAVRGFCETKWNQYRAEEAQWR
jgi:hypothetical protein